MNKLNKNSQRTKKQLKSHLKELLERKHFNHN